ncbi:MAG TPA: flippase activity-associated protein Agl23 [Dehalococcoidia bacterium]
MSSVVERPEAVRPAGLPAALARIPARLRATRLELAAYATVLLTAAILRFWDLGSRALHHDESLHAQFSWYFYQGLRAAISSFPDGAAGHAFYHHDPMMHGTFLFHVTAFTFLLLGDSDYTARVPAALFGTLLVALPFLFRHRLGRVGAVAASAMLALSPTLLYFSRFARNDIWVAAFTLAMVIAIWRYLDEGRPRWLSVLAGALALSFASKETTYIAAAVFLVFLDCMVAADLLDRVLPVRDGARGAGAASLRRAAAFLALAPVAWLAVALWPALGGLRRRVGLDAMPRSGHVLLVLGTLTLPQFAAGIQVPLEALGVSLAGPPSALGGWFPDQEHLVGWATILTLLAAAAAVGLAWDPRTWGVAFLVFFGIFAFFYTTMFTWVPEGIFSGFWRGLDYWLAQHEVQRGGQPVFYYLMLLPVYEFLPLAAVLVGGLVSVARGSTGRAALFFATAGAYVALVPGGPLAARPLLPTLVFLAVATYAFSPDRFRQFLAFWLFGSLFAYSVAGEKMPWLLTHLALPAVLLAAVLIDDFVRWLLRRLPDGLGPWAVAGPVLSAASVGALAALLLLERRDGGPWLAAYAAAVAGVAGLALLLARRASPRWAAGAAAAGVAGLLAVFSVRAAYMASFQHGDVPVELLVYTQTSPALVDVRDRIERLAEESGQGRDLPITVDATDSFSWPWAWYLRDFHSVTYPTVRGGPAPPYTPVMILNASNAGAVAPYGDAFAEGQRFPHRWWFPEDYKRLTAEDFWAGLLRAERWRTWWDYWMWRKTPSPIGSVDAVVYVPAPEAQGGGATPEPREVAGSLVIGRLGTAPGAFNQPAGIAVGPDGSVYVADTHNHRIQKFGPDGRFVAQAGAPGAAPSQFNEPWGLAVDARGYVYVADTWNHRIQKLDPDLRYVTSWGAPARDLSAPGPYDLYGPRAVAVDREGNVLVADTGNKRVLRYTPDGEFLGQAGGPGAMDEPVGLAVAPNGDVLVADAWNGRVLRLNAALTVVAAYPVQGWESRDRLAKPYLALLPDGRVLLSAPAAGQVQVLAPDGTAQALTAPPGGGDPFAYPAGVAADATGRVYVVELGASRVRRFTLGP